MQVATVAMDLAKDVFELAFADALEHGDNALPTALHGLLQQLDALESMMVRIEAQLSSFAKQDAASRVGWVERSDTHQQATAELPRLCAGYFLCRTAPLVARTAKPARRASAAGASQESHQRKHSCPIRICQLKRGRDLSMRRPASSKNGTRPAHRPLGLQCWIAVPPLM